jgi:TonB family protein
MTLCPKGLLAGCVTVVLATTSAQQTTARPVVTLSRIEVVYPVIAEFARVGGTVTVRVAVRPDGSVSETTLLQQDVRLLSDAAVNAASRATFECRQCTEPATPHTITFVFSILASLDSPPPPVWKQTGDASWEVTIFSHTYLCDHCGPREYKPSRVRAARCLWLWRCSET